MELQDIRTEVRTRMGLSTSDANFTDAILTTLVNAALRQISLEFDWPWLEVETTASTVGGTETITLATNVRKVTHMQWEYRELLYRNFRDRHMFYNVTGTPVAFSEKAGSFYIWPTPAAAYTINYGYILDTEPTLVNDTDEPLMSDWAINLVITRTAMLVARRGRDRDLEKVFMAEYSQLIASIKDDLVRVQLGVRPKRVGQRGYLQ